MSKIVVAGIYLFNLFIIAVVTPYNIQYPQINM